MRQYVIQTGHGGRGWEEKVFIIEGKPSSLDLLKLASLMNTLEVDGSMVIRRGDDILVKGY